MVATLLLAGLRAGELCQLRWRDIDLANGRVHVGRSKTQAGLREITLLPLLRDELAAHKAAAQCTDSDDLVFSTVNGRQRDKDNLRTRVLAPVVRLADEILADRGQPPLPAGSARISCATASRRSSSPAAKTPPRSLAQLGHTDPKFTLRVYTHLMRRDPAERARPRALVYGEDRGEGAKTAGSEPRQIESCVGTPHCATSGSHGTIDAVPTP